MSDSYNVVLLDENAKKDTLELFNRVFNNSCNMKFWENKHYANPFGHSLFWGIYDRDRLIAMNGFMRMQYVINENIYDVLESCESAVDQEYRHKGLFTMIVNKAEQWARENNIDFLFGMPNMFSYPGFLKMGWENVSVAKSWGMIKNIRIWGKKKEKRRPIANTLLVLSWIKNRVSSLDDNGFSIVSLNSQEFIDNRLCPSKACNYTKDFADWKFNGFIRSYLVKNDKEKVLMASVNDNSVVYIEEYGQPVQTTARAFRLLCERVFENTGIIELCVDERVFSEQIIKRAGFVTRRQTPYYRITKRISERTKKTDFFEGIIIQTIEAD